MSVLISMLAAETGLSESDVKAIVSNAPRKYKVFFIKKRNGGVRKISQPSRELKALQRVLCKKVLDHLPVHPCATAYRKGSSIRDNAARHAGDGPILKFDFENFFPSLTARDWVLYCKDKSLFATDEDMALSASILFRRGDGQAGLHLAIGAPSSPSLSNILMYNFDKSISELVARDKVTYTRYADDLTFSAPRMGHLNGVERLLRRLLRDTPSPSLKINEEKTVSATRKFKRLVTGLILANDGTVSLGHVRKRNIRAALHYAIQNRLDAEELGRLEGMLAFVNDVEPNFLKSLKLKYGEAVVEALKRPISPPRED